ncbi:MAG TPA: CopG family transcriptional regulator [Elusimicrobiota bacterium]|nr:CopG family transcriptional regulator [Elusimicrobiota bacterium]
MKHRTTIMLPPELKRRAAKRAKERGVSFGELVRESLAAVLTGGPDAKDSLLADHAVYRGKTPRDLAAEHDRRLYDEEA